MSVDQDRLSRIPPRIALYVAFAATGAVTNLLGPILPVLEQRWHLNDQQAGELFTLQFSFSTFAAIFSSRNTRISAPLGMGLAAAGVFLLVNGDIQSGRLAVMLFGAGLGLAITSMNLLVAAEAPPARRSAEIGWMNFSWVLGAISFPLLYHFLSRTGLDGLLIGLALVAAASGSAVAILFRARHVESPSDAQARSFHPRSLLFALFFFLYVGVEVGLAGWLPTYVDRAGRDLAGSSALAVFWGALLVGRFAVPALLRGRQHRTLLFIFLSMALAASLTLAGSRAGMVLLAASALAGLGLAPLFPLNLALFAHSVPSHKNSGWVLACGGLGAAVLPVLMGAVSTRAGSLRVALAVPVFGLALLIAIAAFYREPLEAGSTRA